MAQVPLCYQYKYTSIKKMKKQPTCKPNVFSTKFSVITVKECLHYSDKFCTVKLLVLHIKMAKKLKRVTIFASLQSVMRSNSGFRRRLMHPVRGTETSRIRIFQASLLG